MIAEEHPTLMTEISASTDAFWQEIALAGRRGGVGGLVEVLAVAVLVLQAASTGTAVIPADSLEAGNG